MNRYRVDDKTYAVLDNELWLLVSSDDAPNEHPILKHQYRKAKSIVKGQRKTRKRVDEEIRQEVLKAYREGRSQRDLVEDFGLSNATIYRIIKFVGQIAKQVKHHQVPLKNIHGYRCINCGKTFKSILPKLDAYCPMPTCNKTSELEEIPPEEIV